MELVTTLLPVLMDFYGQAMNRFDEFFGHAGTIAARTPNAMGSSPHTAFKALLP